MSILIKGMEMPKSCSDCPMCYDMMQCSIAEPIINFFKVKEFEFCAERHPRCPLVEIPPHGRLIEKNAVFELIRSFPSVDRQLPVEFMKALYELPTIIEAEEGE